MMKPRFYGPLCKAVFLPDSRGLLSTNQTRAHRGSAPTGLGPRQGWDPDRTPAAGTAPTGSWCASAQTPGRKTGSATGVFRQRTSIVREH